MIAGQLSWHTTAALAWVIFGGGLLIIEFSDSQEQKNTFLRVQSRSWRRRRAYLWLALCMWIFGIVIFLLTRN